MTRECAELYNNTIEAFAVIVFRGIRIDICCLASVRVPFFVFKIQSIIKGFCSILR